VTLTNNDAAVLALSNGDTLYWLLNTYDFITSAKAQIVRLCLSLCLCAVSRTKLCMDLHEIFTKLIFILEVIRIDLHYHLEVTVTQQGHFGIKSTVAQKR